MARQNHAGASGKQVPNGRQRLDDPRVVGHLAVLQRTVEVYPYEDALVFKRVICKRFDTIK
jgi:hypothetical protein